ncbi:putative membrane protein [Luteibacter rhizovicinus]|uniref:Putative membrane protein n=1 Tax=Luteibacter rhizovicinus TaxID=242606 RepID=A0A4R3YKM3_9GAMM|nr:DUF2061 domain-containing protein [Luteibacter rhizovicinus]TCV91594.1 putative membrane protein [Luteibacter rhizovicinus]
MARAIKYAATHFSIAFSMSYAVNQSVLASTAIGVAEPIAFAFGRRAFRQDAGRQAVREPAKVCAG